MTLKSKATDLKQPLCHPHLVVLHRHPLVQLVDLVLELGDYEQQALHLRAKERWCAHQGGSG